MTAGHGLYAAPDPNQKLYNQYGGKDKYLAAKKARDTAVSAANNSIKPYEAANTALLYSLNSVDQNNLGLYAQLRAAQAGYGGLDPKKIQAQITSTINKISANNTKIYEYDLKIKNAQDKFDKANLEKAGSGNKGSGTGAKSISGNPGPWKYNAPLINSSYFLNKGDLPKMIAAGVSSSGDALSFWQPYYTSGNPFGTVQGTLPGKGTIQMDRLTNTAEFKANAQKEAAKNHISFDPNYYGFKFHYNPTTVNMSWSGIMGANPVFEAASLDPAIPMSQNLYGGSLSFDILLNRIQDLALLNPDGTYKQGENPYPYEVDIQDRKDIVAKGTMYDLEYLFHAMHGFMSSTNFTSTLMNKTNDPGWLPVRPVELHLGNKLRYRVRVNGLEVVHKIFSEKMVPILSVATFTCLRYWDGPVAKDPKKK